MLECTQYIPEIEQVAEKVPPFTLGRALRKVSVEFIKAGGLYTPGLRNGFLPTVEAKKIMDDLHRSSDLMDYGWRMVIDHLYPVRGSIHLMANTKAHPDMWMRDFVYASEFTQNASLDDNILKSFEKRQRSNGQIPTAIGLVGQTPWHFADDESTLLYVIKAAEVACSLESSLTKIRREKVALALGFINQHVHNFMYVTPKGERRGWLDAFIYPQADVITQNQGLYAVALLSADNTGFGIPAEEIKNAAYLYSKMGEIHGFLPLSARFDESPDISTLYPEYLAKRLFGQEFLSDGTVEATLDFTPKSKQGYKVLCKSIEGDYFDPGNFVAQYEKGKYQNGGVWPLWQNNALVVGEMHGIINGDLYREAVMQQLEASVWAESIRTGGNFEDVFTPERPDQVWNVAIPATHRTVDRLMRDYTNN